VFCAEICGEFVGTCVVCGSLVGFAEICCYLGVFYRILSVFIVFWWYLWVCGELREFCGFKVFSLILVVLLYLRCFAAFGVVFRNCGLGLV